MLEILCNNNLAFSIEKNEHGDCTLIRFDCDTGNSSPISIKARRVPYNLRPVVEAEIQTLLKEKTIRESSSPWSAPLVLVRKKNGEWRTCVDFRKLNEITRKDSYPLPRCDDLIESCGRSRSKYFTKLDLRKGFL